MAGAFTGPDIATGTPSITLSSTPSGIEAIAPPGAGTGTAMPSTSATLRDNLRLPPCLELAPALWQAAIAFFWSYALAFSSAWCPALSRWTAVSLAAWAMPFVAA